MELSAELPVRPGDRDRRDAGHRADHPGPRPEGEAVRADLAGRAPGDSIGAVIFHEAADEYAEAAWIAAVIDRLLGGTSFHCWTAAGPTGMTRQARAGRYRRALPHRRPGGVAGPGADPGRAAVPEAVTRPAGPAYRGGRHDARDEPGRRRVPGRTAPQ